MKKKTEKVKEEPKEDVKSLLLHLESEYRKANISEKHYKELKEKYQKMMEFAKPAPKKETHKKPIEKKETFKEIPIDIPKPAVVPIVEEPEVLEAPQENIEDSNVNEEPSEDSEDSESSEVADDSEIKRIEEQAQQEMAKPAKKGLFGSLFGKKKDNSAPAQDSPSGNPSASDPPKPDSKPVAKKPKKEEEEEEITEITPEVIERLALKAKEQAEHEGEEAASSEDKKSTGFLKSIFGKKGRQEGSEAQEQAQQPSLQPVQYQPKQSQEDSSEAPAERYKSPGADYGVEIEKIKVMIESARENGKLTDEGVRNLAENLGEIRSMVFQTDADLKENAVKMEKIEDDINEVKPDEIAKKFREIDEKFEKDQLVTEKLDRKTEDSSAKINKVFEILKSIGGIENLVNINTDIQKKLDDINEAMKYVERIGMKTEKMFIELNKGLQDLVIIRSQQDDFNESLKDIIKNIDSVSVKFEGYISKKDMDSFKEDVMLIKKQIDEVKKVLPIADLKLPENIIALRKEREDIKMLMDSLQDQYEMRKISRSEYENIKNANSKRSEEIKVSLEDEWKKVQSLIKSSEGGAQVEEEIEKRPEKIEDDIKDEKNKEAKEKIKSANQKSDEIMEESLESDDQTSGSKQSAGEPEVEESLVEIEKEAQNEMKSEPIAKEAKKGLLKSLFNKKKTVEQPSIKQEAPKEIPKVQSIEVKVIAPSAAVKAGAPEIKAKEPDSVKSDADENKKSKKYKKETKSRSGSVSKSERERKLQILREIKKMR
ncbi:MAG: hypothetical protein V1678_00600 [Candidatus Aenigmatarchaeota archaeon]